MLVTNFSITPCARFCIGCAEARGASISALNRCAWPTRIVTPGFLPSRDTRTSLYNVGQGREQAVPAHPALTAFVHPCTADAEASFHSAHPMNVTMHGVIENLRWSSVTLCFYKCASGRERWYMLNSLPIPTPNADRSKSKDYPFYA